MFQTNYNVWNFCVTEKYMKMETVLVIHLYTQLRLFTNKAHTC